MEALLPRNRRAVLDGLGRILDASGLEELFSGPDDEAAFLYDLLHDAARGRSSSHYWEVVPTARRRGGTPEYVIDRATVLSAAIGERRRTDLYRLLGVPPLASADVIRGRWLEVAKRHHPDVGGDGALFRRAKEAYEVLRDDARRMEYERFWLQALGPFERIAPAEEPSVSAATPVAAEPEPEPEPTEPSPRIVEVREEEPPPVTEPERLDSAPAALFAAARLLAKRDSLGLHGAGATGIGSLLEQLDKAFSQISLGEIERCIREVDAGVARLQELQTVLGRIAAMKRQIVV